MNKQASLFGSRQDEPASKYTGKIEAPIYEPRHTKPQLLLLYDDTRSKALIREIDNAEIPEEEKAFLRAAAWRHTVFHYERIADYYAHSGPRTKKLMEQSALVIIDFGNAIELGFVRLCDDIRKQYLEEHADDANEAP